jgi:4-hydroxythreonine-4-phosphate dehydrogenase
MTEHHYTIKAPAMPLVAITMGDAAGIGPEIVVKVLHSRQIRTLCRPIVIGDGTVIDKTIRSLNSRMKLNHIRSINEATGKSDRIDLIDLHNLNAHDVVPGEICSTCGKAAFEYIEKGARLALNNAIDALVTAPVNKKAAQLAGLTDVGHLEFLARLTGVTDYATMLVSGPLRVVHHTTHYSLSKACTLVTREGISTRLNLIDRSFRQWGISHPSIAVAALNPHAGEEGMLGLEEINEIAPAIRDAQEAGIDARGPYPADTVFTRCIRGEFDVVLAMYHDQGHIPVKVYGFEKSVSIALGLPFIRTSVDHGTAFDIAGKGIADPQSLKEAIRVAISFARGHGLIGIQEKD